MRAWTAFVEQADPDPDGDGRRCGRRSCAAGSAPAWRSPPDVVRGADGRRVRHTSPSGRSPRSRSPSTGSRTSCAAPPTTATSSLAVTDADTRILWTYGGRVMRRKAESVNFVAGGRWDESHVGTNALALANHDDRPSMVFSAEHYAPIVHNWVCWAAPVHDPATGLQLGVIDLSTTWDRTHPIGLATARMMARLIENALPAAGRRHRRHRRWSGTPSTPVSMLHLLGRVEAVLDGQRLLLTRRQGEILALLALHPEGLALEQLHTLLYGDHAVTFSTLKAEISHLRSALGGQLASRPYRLMMPVDTDVDTVLDLLRAGEVEAAVGAFGGELMPGTSSPALAELGDYVAVAVREALLADPKPGAVLRYSSAGAVRHRGGGGRPSRHCPSGTRRGRCSRVGSRPRATDRSGRRCARDVRRLPAETSRLPQRTPCGTGQSPRERGNCPPGSPPRLQPPAAGGAPTFGQPRRPNVALVTRPVRRLSSPGVP